MFLYDFIETFGIYYL